MEIARVNLENLVFRYIETVAKGKSMTLAEASAMKLYAAQTAVDVTLEAVQIHGGNGYMAPWIDTDKCTACDECIHLNPNIFVYNDQKKAIIKDPQGGPYKDLVKAAERCTAGVIHPGLPKDRSSKGIDKLIARAERYNQ